MKKILLIFFLISISTLVFSEVCSNQLCDNNPADGFLDESKNCSGTFDSWFVKDAYKNMLFTNGWSNVDDEWISSLDNNWYWAQGNCELGTYPRSLLIDTNTGWAWGKINCNQDGINYCDTSFWSDQTIENYPVNSTLGEKVLELKIKIDKDNTPILVQFTGTWSCSTGSGNIYGYLKIDGVNQENSIISQAFNYCPTAHSLLSHSAINLNEGTHTIEFFIKKSGNLKSQINSGTFLTAFKGFEKIEQYPIPQVTVNSTAPISIFSINIPASSHSRLVEFSGSLQLTDAGASGMPGGDALTKIYLDDKWVGNLGINDLLDIQDEFAPFSNQYLIQGDNKTHKLELKAHRLYFNEYRNTVIFKFLPGSSIIIATASSNDLTQRAVTNDLFISPSNSENTILSHNFIIPNNLSQDFLILGQGRWLEYNNEGSGTANAWITFDNNRVGSTASQQYKAGHSISQRTFQVSALLKDVQPGNHTIILKSSTYSSSMPNFAIGAGSNLIIIPVKAASFIPICTSTDWMSSDDTCQSSNTLTRTWTKIGTCTEGVTHPTTESIPCTYTPINPICSQFSQRYSNTQIINEITKWKNGNRTLIEVLKISKLWKYCS